MKGFAIFVHFILKIVEFRIFELFLDNTDLNQLVKKQLMFKKTAWLSHTNNLLEIGIKMTTKEMITSNIYERNFK